MGGSPALSGVVFDVRGKATGLVRLLYHRRGRKSTAIYPEIRFAVGAGRARLHRTAGGACVGASIARPSLSGRWRVSLGRAGNARPYTDCRCFETYIFLQKYKINKIFYFALNFLRERPNIWV